MKYLLYLCVLGMLASCRSNAGMVDKIGEREIILTAFSKRVDLPILCLSSMNGLSVNISFWIPVGFYLESLK